MSLGIGGAVEGQERRLGALRVGVQQACDHFFSGARFSGYEDGDRRCGNTPDRCQNLTHLFRDEQCTQLLFDRLFRPQCSAPAFVLAVPFKFDCCAADSENVLHQDDLFWRVWYLALDDYGFAAIGAKRQRN